MENNQSDTQSNNGPAHVIRDGRLKATIWQNQGEKGPYWTVDYAKTIAGQDGKPRDVRGFSETDNLRIEKLCGEAHSAIREIKREWYQGQSQSQTHELNQFKQARQNPKGQVDQPTQNQQKQAF